MPPADPTVVWSLQYKLVASVILGIVPELARLNLDPKELFVLAEIDEHPYPAALSEVLWMPKPTLTANLKRLEAAGFVRREIDPDDLRRHKLLLTPSGRRATTRGVAVISEALGARLARLSVAEQRDLQGLLEKLS